MQGRKVERGILETGEQSMFGDWKNMFGLLGLINQNYVYMKMPFLNMLFCMIIKKTKIY